MLLCTIAIIVALFFTQCTFAQAPTIQWQKSFGGSSSDKAYTVQQTTDGGYVLAGESWSTDGDVSGNHGNGKNDYWITKLDSNGNLQWQKCLGGSDYEVAYSIQQTADGGYVIAGYSYSSDGNVTGIHGTNEDYWIVKLDNSGNLQWQKCLGGSYGEQANSIKQTTDGGYIVAGSSQSVDGDVTGVHLNGGLSSFDYWVVKLDNYGNLEWQKAVGGSDYDYASSIQQTADGGYVVAGYTKSIDGDVTGFHGGLFYDFWIVKLDNSGNLQWQKCLGGGDWDQANSINQTLDGGYVIAGYTKSIDGDVTGNHGGSDFWIVKLDNGGNLLWQKCMGGSYNDVATSIQQTMDGEYVVAGYTTSTDGDVTGHHGGVYDFWIVKLNNTGALQWQKTLGGSNGETANSIQQTADGGYVVAGSGSSIDGDGTVHQGGGDYWIVKLNSSAIGLKENDSLSFNIYPNPTKESIRLVNLPLGSTITITDISGKTVCRSINNNTQIIISTSTFANGVYIIKVENNGEFANKKLLVIK